MYLEVFNFRVTVHSVQRQHDVNLINRAFCQISGKPFLQFKWQATGSLGSTGKGLVRFGHCTCMAWLGKRSHTQVPYSTHWSQLLTIWVALHEPMRPVSETALWHKKVTWKLWISNNNKSAISPEITQQRIYSHSINVLHLCWCFKEIVQQFAYLLSRHRWQDWSLQTLW